MIRSDLGRPRLRLRAALIVWLGSACRPDAPPPDPGVSSALARERAATISNLSYDLGFDLPGAPDQPVTGTVTLRFDYTGTGPAVLDFKAPRENTRSVTSLGRDLAYTWAPDHLVIPLPVTDSGPAEVTVAFTATDAALNRQSDFLYGLFVPDRASTAFPSFDQPDLKARFRLRLRVPAGWGALSNGALVSRDSTDPAVHALQFAETRPISTYLFTFAAGNLASETAERDGRRLTMYHRETDTARVARNRDAIFDLQARALRWLEDYTGIPFPFDKFAFFAVPSFQFGGMEHPGAVWYRASSLFLDRSATENQRLDRASLIGHETAHMWFGDLVTMPWFDDVWMKEVFANFMAAKIVEPAFPAVNHQLRFFLAHHPTAYAVDRTAGANPIRQPLENLNDAASLYGAIIYQKAPIVMRQLEALIGPDVMGAGLRTYLDRFRYGNAGWADLVAILDDLSPEDLAGWSRAWVDQPGRPTIAVERLTGDSGVRVRLTQRDPRGDRNLTWSQRLVVAFPEGGAIRREAVLLVGPEATLDLPRSAAGPGFVLPGADGLGYGRFVLDSASRAALLATLPSIADPVVKAVAWTTLEESVQDGVTPPGALLDVALRALDSETDPLLVDQIIGVTRAIFWGYLDAGRRLAAAPAIEAVLWRGLERAGTPGRKASYFNALVSMALGPASVGRLERVWAKADSIPGLPLGERQYTALAEALAIRETAAADSVLDVQEARIDNPDRLARLRFVRPALSRDPARRDSVFRSLADPANRRHEPWVLDLLGALNHPLRAPSAERSLVPALDLMEEIKATGDIFFPTGWVGSVLSGHQSATAASLVAGWLDRHRDLAPRLRGKILQAADGLFRSARVVSGWTGGSAYLVELERSAPGRP